MIYSTFETTPVAGLLSLLSGFAEPDFFKRFFMGSAVNF